MSWDGLSLSKKFTRLKLNQQPTSASPEFFTSSESSEQNTTLSADNKNTTIRSLSGERSSSASTTINNFAPMKLTTDEKLNPRHNIHNENYRKTLSCNKYIDFNGQVSNVKTGLKFIKPLFSVRENYKRRPTRSGIGNTWKDKILIDIIKENNYNHLISDIIEDKVTLDHEGLGGLYKELTKFAICDKYRSEEDLPESTLANRLMRKAVDLAQNETDNAFFPKKGFLKPLNIKQLQTDQFKAIKKLDSNPGFRYQPVTTKREVQDRIYKDAEELIEIWKGIWLRLEFVSCKI